MKRIIKDKTSLFRLSDSFLPTALLAASILGRGPIALNLFIALCVVRTFGLSGCYALRPAFAAQPSVRYVQGSVLMTLFLQLAGTIITCIFLPLSLDIPDMLPFFICGSLLNIEHMFYEYLFAIGDRDSASLCRAITSILIFTGTLLTAPPWHLPSNPSDYDLFWLMIASGISSIIGLTISACLGGVMKPRFSTELFKHVPLSMLQNVLYPAPAIAITYFSGLGINTSMPLFAGLIVYELCRTPFRRSTSESKNMNRILLVVFAIAMLGFLPFALKWISKPENPLLHDIPYACCAIVLASLCGFVLYGNVNH